MKELWSKFIFGFCKVDFVCWQGEPNWLGWIILVIGGFFALMFFLWLILIFSER